MPEEKVKFYDANEMRFEVMINSGDGEEFDYCHLTFGLRGKMMRIIIPNFFLRPHRKKVVANTWDEATIKRLGRNWYWRYTPRRFGIYLFENHFNVCFGLDSGDSSTEQRWSCFLPWEDWEHRRNTILNPDGSVFFNCDSSWNFHSAEGMSKYDRMRKAEEDVPKMVFTVRDFDGTILTATCHLEEREWTRGTKWCKWLKYFTKPRIVRSLEVSYDQEQGPRKGSWKGGTLSVCTPLEVQNDSPFDAFMRFCKKENLTYVAKVQ